MSLPGAGDQVSGSDDPNSDKAAERPARINQPGLTEQERQLLALLRLQAQPQGEALTHALEQTVLRARLFAFSQPADAYPSGSLGSTLPSFPVRNKALLPAHQGSSLPLPHSGTLVALSPRRQLMGPTGCHSPFPDPFSPLSRQGTVSSHEAQPPSSGMDALASLDPLQCLREATRGGGGASQAGASDSGVPEDLMLQHMAHMLEQQQQQQQQILSSWGQSATPSSRHVLQSFLHSHQGSSTSSHRAPSVTSRALGEVQMLLQSLPGSGLHEPAKRASQSWAGGAGLGFGGLEEVMRGALGVGGSQGQAEHLENENPCEAAEGVNYLSAVQGRRASSDTERMNRLQQSRGEAQSPARQAVTGSGASRPERGVSGGGDIGDLSLLFGQPSSTTHLHGLLLREGTKYPAGFQALLNAAAQSSRHGKATAGCRSPRVLGNLPNAGAQGARPQQSPGLMDPGLLTGPEPASPSAASLELKGHNHNAQGLSRFQPVAAESREGKLDTVKAPSLAQSIRATLSEGARPGIKTSSSCEGGLARSRLSMPTSKAQSLQEGADTLGKGPCTKRARMQEMKRSGGERGSETSDASSDGEGNAQGASKKIFSDTSSGERERLHRLSDAGGAGQSSGLSGGTGSTEKVLTEEEKRRRKLELNKEAARRMRERKAMRLERLEKRTLELKASNWETQKQHREATSRMERLKWSMSVLEGKVLDVVQELNLAKCAIDAQVLQEQLVLLGEVCSPEALDRLIVWLPKSQNSLVKDVS